MTVPAARDVLSCAFFFLSFFNKCSRLYVLQPSHCHHAPTGPENHPTQLLKCIHAVIHSMQGRLAAAFKAVYSWCMSLFDGAALITMFQYIACTWCQLRSCILHCRAHLSCQCSSWYYAAYHVHCTFPCGYVLMTWWRSILQDCVLHALMNLWAWCMLGTERKLPYVTRSTY